MPEYEITVKYTRKLSAIDEKQLLYAIDITQTILMSNTYEILEIKEIKENIKELIKKWDGLFGYYFILSAFFGDVCFGKYVKIT